MRISFDDFDEYDGGENEHDDGDFSFNQFLTFDLNSEQGGCNVPARNFLAVSSNLENHKLTEPEGTRLIRTSQRDSEIFRQETACQDAISMPEHLNTSSNRNFR